MRSTASTRSLASFAPLLLAAAADDDWVATSTLARETNALAQQVGWLATARGRGGRAAPRHVRGARGPSPCTPLPSRQRSRRHLPGWSVRRSVAEPAEGALALAERLGEDGER